jgi:uncharacterized membrane protein YhfC
VSPPLASPGPISVRSLPSPALLCSLVVQVQNAVRGRKKISLFASAVVVAIPPVDLPASLSFEGRRKKPVISM